MALYNNLRRYRQGRCCYAYFTNEEPGSERLKELFNFMKLNAKMGLEPIKKVITVLKMLII